jgi:hypothetical protein
LKYPEDEMKTLRTAAGLIFLIAALSPSLMAQWPSYPSRGVPKTPDGKPDLTAPAPRMANGKPDFSGMWENARGGPNGGQRGAGNAGQRGAVPAPAAQASAPAGPPLATFFSIGAGFKEGLPLQPWAAELVKKRMADNQKDNPDAHCLPMGFMQFHLHPQPRKIIQNPDEMVVIYEANSGLRQIFTDGRPLPNNDPQPWWYGYSAGHWEGDTLVVETIGFTDLQWLDVNGDPLTDQGRVIEKFRRPNFGTLDIEVTVDDPKAYTKPFTVRVQQRIMVDTELIEFICEDRDATHYVGAK